MYNILLVEDDRITSKLIQKYITDLGYSVAAAVASGEDAVLYIKSHAPDLVLMDINIEGKLDGIESAKSINQLYSIPFVYITSSADESTIERARDSNAYGYIIKPFDKKDLRASIEMAIVRHAMESRIRNNEARVSTILNNIVDAVVVMEENGDVSYVNDAASKILDTEKSFLLGKSAGDVIKIGSDSREEVSSYIPMGMDYFEFNNYLVTDKKKIPADFTSTPIRNDNGRIAGTVLVIRDITQQVEFEKRIQENLDAISRIMYGVIEAMTKAVETRDPYTAGHQQNVADIAVAIAKDMGLSRDVVESVNLAGQIHDLGKIAIPAEILSKPGKISELEYKMIQTHPQVGYDILKHIDFPWPIAEIIYQHHEKMDGTGYPQAFKGEEIFMEARIITVADVVEAMASHRPYRASLGIEAALFEIQKNKGKSFDPDVVESCIRIFEKDEWKNKF